MRRDRRCGLSRPVSVELHLPPPPPCGAGVVNQVSEQCDGTDDAACPGQCLATCTCPVQQCGNNIREGTEQCDGTDDVVCPGQCLATCVCPVQQCGNNIREGTEQCDGTDATACPGQCQPDCTCVPDNTCEISQIPVSRGGIVCGGDCPPGEVCVDGGGFCTCVPDNAFP